MNKYLVSLLSIAILVGVGFLLFNKEEKAEAVAGQLSATIATSSTITIANTARVVFATSTCTTRIVTTNDDSIRFEFSDIDNGFTLGVDAGHLQPASTTVAYDASVYGCGLWRMIKDGSDAEDTTVQVSETR